MNPLKNDAPENRRKRLAQCAKVLTRYFDAWSQLPGSSQVTQSQMGVYLVALSDLTPEEIEYGCQEATKVAERFPWPGHIRKFAEANRMQNVFLGPPMIHYPDVPQEEREAALEFSGKLKEALGPAPTRSAETKPLKVVPSKRTIEEQKEILKKRGLLPM